jgi:hypothetical protein
MFARPTASIRTSLIAVFVSSFCLAVFVAAPAAVAQNRDRLRNELETTQRILERARDVVEESGSPRAIEPLRIAFQLQERAVHMAQSQHQGDWLQAFERTKQARTLAQRAMSIAAQQAQLERRAQQEIMKLERLLERIHEHADSAPSERAQQLMEMSQRRLLQARQAFHEQRFEEAMNLAHDVRRLLETLVPRQSARRFDRMLENTQRLMERAQEVAGTSDNDQALALLQRAQQQFEAAQRTHAEGRPEAAFRHLNQSRDLAMRSLRLTEGPVDSARLDALLQETSSYIDNVMNQLGESGSSEAVTMIENAQRHMNRAFEYRTENKLRQALAEARVARNLAQRAADLARDAGI